VSSGGTASDTTVPSGGVLIVLKGAAAIDTTINSGGTAIVSSGGTFAVQAIAANSGTLINSGIVIIASGGTAIVNGSVRNSGTLFASGSSSLLEIVSGAVVSGGVAKVGNGIVEIQGASGENVTFLPNGNGALVLDGLGSAYTGRVSGFGGVGHTNSNQSIDFTSINFGGATLTYTRANSSNTSGTLTVTDGTHHSATVTLVGAYSAGSFQISADSQGHLVITDPVVVDGGSVGIDPAQIAFYAHTTLAYTENRNNTGGTRTVIDGKNTANFALLGNYMAASFACAGNGGTLITVSIHTVIQQDLLTHPHP
jgi:autotransporter passenger strand-loop-strand repeat protein